jgi:hypothetical protein
MICSIVNERVTLLITWMAFLNIGVVGLGSSRFSTVTRAVD